MRIATRRQPRRWTLAALAAWAVLAADIASAERRFYASSVSYCSSARAIEVEKFLLEYLPDYPPYGAISFDISAASVSENLNANLNFDLTAYGINAINTTVELCSLLGGILCPLPQYDFVGSATIPLPPSVGQDINIPEIGYWIPDLEATATVRLVRVSDGSEAACLRVDLSNGLTVRHGWVSWILGGLVLICVLLSTLWFLAGTLAYPAASLVAPASPLAANAAWAALGRRKERLFLVFSLYQFVATTGLLSLRYPNVYASWTGNYAWSLGLIRETPVANAIDELRNNTGGNLTRLAGTSGLVGGTEALRSIFSNTVQKEPSIASVLGSAVLTAVIDGLVSGSAAANSATTSLAARSVRTASSLVPHFNKRQAATGVQAAALPVPVVQNQPDPYNIVHTGIPKWLVSLDISPYDGFMVVFFNFLFLCAIAIALILLGAAVWALLRFASRRRANKRRRALGISLAEDEKRGISGTDSGDGRRRRFGRVRGVFHGPFWTVVRANTLRLLMISWYPILLFTFYQWTLGSSDSYAPIVLSVFTAVFTTAAILILAIRFVILARRALRPGPTVGAEESAFDPMREKQLVHSSPFQSTPALEPVNPNPDPKHALKKAERRDVERYWTGTFLACRLGPYSPFWNAYKLRSRRTTSKRRNWWKGRGWWFGLLDLILAPVLTALFIGFAQESGWTQSIALVVIEALLFLVICCWTPYEDKSSNATHIFWAACRVVIAGALIPFNASLELNEIARTAIGFILAVIEMVLAALFGLLLAIDLVQLIIFSVRGFKARRQARRSGTAGALPAHDGAGLPPMQQHMAADRTGAVRDDMGADRTSDSDDTLAHSSPNPQTLTGHDFAAAPAGPNKCAGKVPSGQDDSLEVHPATQAERGDSAENEQEPASDAGSDADAGAGGAQDEEDDDEASADSQGFWEAEAILDEDKTRYLIAWKGTDIDGTAWQPTWEPKANANQTLVDSWRQQQREARKPAKAAKAAEKKRKLELKTAKQAKKKPVAPAAKVPGSSTEVAGKHSTPSLPRKAADDFVIEIDDAPSRSSSKRKMVVSSSPFPSNSTGTPHVAKKPKTDAPKVAGSPAKKRVSFDITVSSSDSEGDVAPSSSKQTAKQRVPKPAPRAPAEKTVEIEKTAAKEGPADKNEVEVIGSSGSTHASNSSVIPDSQAVAYTPMQEKEDQPVAPERRSVRFNLPGGLRSPASSQSDLEDLHAHDDDVPVFVPLHQQDEQLSSPEMQPTRRLGPVPVPAASMFGIFDRSDARSSQADPIVDPDSSPNRPTRPRETSALQASPRWPPVKQRLELVHVPDNDTPVSSFEAELGANAASSYVTVPLEESPPTLVDDRLRIFQQAGGASAPRPYAYASTSGTVKRAPVQPVHAAVERIDVDGTVALVGRRWPSPDPVDDDDLVMTQAEEVDLGGLAEQFFDEIFDFEAGAKLDLANSTAASAEAAQDAGENSMPSQGYPRSSEASAPQQSTSSGQSYPAGQTASASTSAAQSGAYRGGAGVANAGSDSPDPLAHFLQQSNVPGAASVGTPKRQHEDDAEAVDPKKPRVNPPPSTQYPESAHAHSPYHALPEHPSFQTTSQVASDATGASGPSPQQAAVSQTQMRIPFVGLTQATPVALASPSLARVQNTDPFVIPRPNTLAPGESSPAPAGTLRSPSPLPASAAPVSGAQVASANSRNVSRNGSPAPSSAQVEDLISLVRASPFIVAEDGTQDELERFLRDPQAYPTIPNAPLLASEFWAFELRRHAINGVEKIDFVVIRSREGTFQLKRANKDKFPIEFSRSLSQVTARGRGMTPMVEGASSVAPYAPAQGAMPAALQPSVSQMSREQLELEVERLRQQSATTGAELSSLRPLTAEVAQLRIDVQTLTKQTKALQSSRESAQADLTYMQAQYQAASQAAVERANECRVAEAEATRLRGMLDNAVQQKEATYKSEIKAVRSMYSRLQKQMAFYKAESRRTQENAIREKAARWDEYLASTQLEAAAAERARADLPAEDSGDDEAPAATAATESQPEPSTIVSSNSSSVTSPVKQGPPRLPSHVPASSLGLDSLPADVTQPDRPLPEIEPAMAAPSHPSSSSHAALLTGDLPVGPAAEIGRDEFRCEWRVGPSDTQAETCGEVKDSRTQLREHVLREHMPE
ncbi:hypothetical protein JCM3774_000898 [Rhodotorula dairenensis]